MSLARGDAGTALPVLLHNRLRMSGPLARMTADRFEIMLNQRLIPARPARPYRRQRSGVSTDDAWRICCMNCSSAARMRRNRRSKDYSVPSIPATPRKSSELHPAASPCGWRARIPIPFVRTADLGRTCSRRSSRKTRRQGANSPKRAPHSSCLQKDRTHSPLPAFCGNERGRARSQLARVLKRGYVQPWRRPHAQREDAPRRLLHASGAGRDRVCPARSTAWGRGEDVRPGSPCSAARTRPHPGHRDRHCAPARPRRTELPSPDEAQRNHPQWPWREARGRRGVTIDEPGFIGAEEADS